MPSGKRCPPIDNSPAREKAGRATGGRTLPGFPVRNRTADTWPEGSVAGSRRPQPDRVHPSEPQMTCRLFDTQASTFPQPGEVHGLHTPRPVQVGDVHIERLSQSRQVAHVGTACHGALWPGTRSLTRAPKCPQGPGPCPTRLIRAEVFVPDPTLALRPGWLSRHLHHDRRSSEQSLMAETPSGAGRHGVNTFGRPRACHPLYTQDVNSDDEFPSAYRVRAELVGHAFDLDNLVTLFPVGDPQVRKTGDTYWVSSSRLEGFGEDSPSLQAAATELLTILNGVARVQISGFRTVTLRGQYAIAGPDGEPRQRAVISAVAAELRVRGTVSAAGIVFNLDGQQVQQSAQAAPNPTALTTILLAETNPEVAEALRLMSQELAWENMYKVFEVVRESVGGEKNLTKQPGGLVTKADLSVFTVSANSHAVSGDAARHARRSRSQLEPPKRTMTLAQGQEFIRTLVQDWVEHLAVSSAGPETLP